MARFKTYYPADEITANLYTAGVEWMTTDNVEYIGSYHRYTTGEVYTKSTWDARTSVKLIPYVAPDSVVKKNEIYVKLKPNFQLRRKSPIEIPVRITAADIKNNYIIRYFLKKINDSKIIEVNRTQYLDWQSDNIDRTLYLGAEMQWFISGNIEDIITGTVRVPGVLTINQENTKVVAIKIPELKSYLSNPLEFYTDSDFIIPVDINGLDS
jgi:hypothetical protein